MKTRQKYVIMANVGDVAPAVLFLKCQLPDYYGDSLSSKLNL